MRAKLSKSLIAVIFVLASLNPQRLQAVTAVGVGTCVSAILTFTTIQAAVTAIPAGGTVLVCPGVYPEQVLIAKPLTLRGVQSGTADAAVVVAPGGGVVQNTTSLATGNGIAAQILVQGTTGVNISRLVVDGSASGLTGCAPNLIGIYYQNASGTVSNVATLNQALAPSLNGCQSGLGIFVQSGNAGASTVTVMNSSVHGYQKNGITGNEAGTTVTILGNTVVGQGPTTGAAENGIQIGFGAMGKVANNTVIDDIYSPATVAASGILIFASAGGSTPGLTGATSSLVTISGNTVGTTQLGIAVVSDPTFGLADGALISGNKVSGTQMFDGIDACSNNNTITGNVVNNSTESGIHLDSTCGSTGSGNFAAHNTIDEACVGMLVGGTGNTTSPDTYFNVTNTILFGTDVCSGSTLAPSIKPHSAGTGHGHAPARP